MASICDFLTETQSAVDLALNHPLYRLRNDLLAVAEARPVFPESILASAMSVSTAVKAMEMAGCEIEAAMNLAQKVAPQIEAVQKMAQRFAPTFEAAEKLAQKLVPQFEAVQKFAREHSYRKQRLVVWLKPSR